MKIVKVKRGMSVERMLEIYRSLPGVVYAEPNYIARANLAAPDDFFFPQQWALSRIAASAGWAIYPGTFAAGGAPIAFVDSGVDAAHPDLAGRVAPGANCVTSFCTPGGASDDNGHGTLGAGIAAATADNGIGVAGVSFGSQIVPVKVLDATGSGTYSAIAAGIIWAADSGARVINLSLAGTATSRTLCDAVQYAVGKGAFVAAAAGNAANSEPVYPAACHGATGVSATAEDDSLAPYSNFGSPNVFVSAPGVRIHTTYFGGTYALATGTSMATSFVSGVAALVLGERPGATVADLRRVLATTSDKVGTAAYGADPYGTCASCTWSATHGYGRVNVQRALASGAQAPTAAEPPAATPTEPAPQPEAPAPAPSTEPPAPPPAQAAPPASLVLSVIPGSRILKPGKEATLKVGVSGLESGAAVEFSLAGLPAGVSYSVEQGRRPGLWELTLVAPASAERFRHYQVTVRASSGSATGTATFTLIVL